MDLSGPTLPPELSCESTQLSVSHSALNSPWHRNAAVPACSPQDRLGLRTDKLARSYPSPPPGLEHTFPQSEIRKTSLFSPTWSDWIDLTDSLNSGALQ